MPWINPWSLWQRARLYHDFSSTPPQDARVKFDSYDVFYKLTRNHKKMFSKYDVSCDARIFLETLLRAAKKFTVLNNVFSISPSELLGRGVI